MILRFAALLLLVLALVVVIDSFRTRGVTLQYLYFVRFPLLFAIALLVLPPLTGWFAPQLMKNVFILSHTWEFAVIVTLAIIAGWVVMYTLLLILNSLDELYPDLAETARQTWWGKPRPWLDKYQGLLFGLLALPTAITLILFAQQVDCQSIDFATCHHPALLPSIVGVLIATGIATLAWLLLILIREPVYHAFDLLRGFIKQLFERFGPSMKLPKDLPSKLPRGYSNRPGNNFRHDAAFVFLLVSAALYLSGYWLLKPGNLWLRDLQVPAAAYVFILLMLVNWLLSGAAFALDRCRVPISLIILVFSFSLYTINDTDHYYSIVPLAPEQAHLNARVQQTPHYQPLYPQGVVSAWQKNDKVEKFPTPIVVFASGGGASAELWTASVLTGLQNKLHSKFGGSIVLISSVSGGTIGSMYYVDGYNNGPPTDTQLDAIVQAAARPTLASVVWGFVYSDFWRALAVLNPFSGQRLHDRGWALQATWQQKLNSINGLPEISSDDILTPTLGDWQSGVRDGWRPAVIFNSTTVETGERMLFASFDVPCDLAVANFHRAYPGYDIGVAVAARMSATFPYVAPAARADVPPKADNPAAKQLSTPPPCPHQDSFAQNQTNPHLVDGGYFDNDGVTSGVEWLQSAWQFGGISSTTTSTITPTRDLLPKRLLIVQIPDHKVKDSSDDGNDEQIQAERDSHGWLYSIAGPLFALMNVRTTSQSERSQVEIQRFIQDAAQHNLAVMDCVLDLQEDTPELSWQLSPMEVARVSQSAKNVITDKRTEEMKAFLQGTTSATNCAQ